MTIKPLSISYGLLRILNASKASSLSFKEIRLAYSDSYGNAMPAVLQGTLTRLRDSGMVATVFGSKKSSKDATALLQYKITSDGEVELAETMAEISAEFGRMHQESIASGKLGVV